VYTDSVRASVDRAGGAVRAVHGSEDAHLLRGVGVAALVCTGVVVVASAAALSVSVANSATVYNVTLE